MAQPTPSNNFCVQNLTKLTLHGCGNLKYLFTSSMVRNFVQLQRLMLCKCSVLEEITVKEVREEERKDQMFPKLMYLIIKDLENLTRFCSGSYIELPSLKVLHIDRCPELKTFISEDTSTTRQLRKKLKK